MRCAMTLPQYHRGEVSVDGVPAHLTPKEAELVALLLASAPDHAVDRTALVEMIWPDPDTQPDTAMRIIYVLVSRCRRKGVPIENDCGWGFFIPAYARGGDRAPAPYFRLAA